MKRILSIILPVLLCVGLVACGGGGSSSTPTSTPTQSIVEPDDLRGYWEQQKNAGQTFYHVAIINDTTITIYWYDESDESAMLYWAGSFIAPTEAGAYSWNSVNDKEQTNMALLASGDDTKIFSYESYTISYSVSFMGETGTVSLVRSNNSFNFGSSESTNPEEGSKFNESEVVSQIEVVEYSYINSIRDSWTILVLKNNSDYNLSIEVSVLFKDDDGKMIGAKNGSENAFESGQEIAMGFSCDEKPASIEWEITAKEETWYECVYSDLSLETTISGNKAIISVTNNGDKAADFVEYTALFFKDGELIGHRTGYCVDSDSELKPGKTIHKEAEIYNDFDTVDVYLTGRR